MKALYGLYADPEGAQRAVDCLARRQLRAQVRRAADRHCLRRAPRGLRICRLARHLESLSLGGAWRRRGRHDWLSADHAFAEVLSHSSPAACPLTPAWTNGIIIYEMIMLGAILTTLVVLLIGARAAEFQRRDYGS